MKILKLNKFRKKIYSKNSFFARVIPLVRILYMEVAHLNLVCDKLFSFHHDNRNSFILIITYIKLNV